MATVTKYVLLASTLNLSNQVFLNCLPLMLLFIKGPQIPVGGFASQAPGHPSDPGIQRYLIFSVDLKKLRFVVELD